MKPAAPPRRPRLQPYLTPQTFDRLRAYLARTGQTESAYVEALVVQDLDNTNERKLILRRLDALMRAAAALDLGLALTTELVGAFLRMWLSRASPLPAERRAEALASAEEELRGVLRHVQQRVNAGRRLVEPDGGTR